MDNLTPWTFWHRLKWFSVTFLFLRHFDNLQHQKHQHMYKIRNKYGHKIGTKVWIHANSERILWQLWYILSKVWHHSAFFKTVFLSTVQYSWLLTIYYYCSLILLQFFKTQKFSWQLQFHRLIPPSLSDLMSGCLLADQLNLYQPGGEGYAHQIILAPWIFRPSYGHIDYEYLEGAYLGVLPYSNCKVRENWYVVWCKKSSKIVLKSLKFKIEI